MGHASIDLSARQSKAIQQAIFDSLMQSESQKPIQSAQPAQHRSQTTIKPSSTATRFGRRNLAASRRYQLPSGRYDHATQQVYEDREPSKEEIQREIDRQKALGAMTELTPAALISSARPDIHPIPLHYGSPKFENPHDLNPKSDSGKLNRRPYWIIAGVASTWLVHSMAQALGGGVWDYMISAAFDYSPMLLIGARVDRDAQKIANIGAVGIFAIGLLLYLAPSIQTAFNEYSSYSVASEQYDLSMNEYRAKSANAIALRDAAKKSAEDSDKNYRAVVEKYGENSWRTAPAKKAKEKGFEEWKRRSESAESLSTPVSPQISNELRNALQTIGMRIGLFAIVFLSMFIMRRLEEEVST
jgi:hypothetical protein